MTKWSQRHQSGITEASRPGFCARPTCRASGPYVQAFYLHASFISSTCRAWGPYLQAFYPVDCRPKMYSLWEADDSSSHCTLRPPTASEPVNHTVEKVTYLRIEIQNWWSLVRSEIRDKSLTIQSNALRQRLDRNYQKFKNPPKSKKKTISIASPKNLTESPFTPFFLRRHWRWRLSALQGRSIENRYLTKIRQARYWGLKYFDFGHLNAISMVIRYDSGYLKSGQ